MELIDREALLRAYDAQHDGPAGRARKLIEDAPTIDAVEVVRCKDCKHSILWYGEITCCEGIYINCAVDENFYCAAGERKADATD